MFENIIQTWNHLKIFQLLLLKAPWSAMGTEDLDLGKSEWYRYTTENQLALPKYLNKSNVTQIQTRIDTNVTVKKAQPQQAM